MRISKDMDSPVYVYSPQILRSPLISKALATHPYAEAL